MEDRGLTATGLEVHIPQTAWIIATIGGSGDHLTADQMADRRRTRKRYTASMSVVIGTRPGRNEPCHCGSGRKYKQCCLAKDETEGAARRAAAQAAATAAEPETATADDSTAPAKPVPTRAAKHQTHQPWKGTTSRGFAPKNRTPRKAGGS